MLKVFLRASVWIATASLGFSLGIGHGQDSPPSNDEVAKLIRQLDDDAYEKREAATQALGKMGEEILPLLDQALADTRSLEAQNRLQSVIDAIYKASGQGLLQDVPRPPKRDLSGNRIPNASLKGLKGWSEMHRTNHEDQAEVGARDGMMVWERPGGGCDGGLIGAGQDVPIDVRGAKTLRLSLDVWIGSHTLPGPSQGWGEAPVRVVLHFEDADGKSHSWCHGFVVQEASGTPFKNYTRTQDGGQWQPFVFDLKDKETWKDYKREAALPPPAKITRVELFGNGWDFKAGVANLVLRTDEAETKK